MIKFIKDKKEVKSYIDEVKKIFEIYKTAKTYHLTYDFKNEKLQKAFQTIEEESEVKDSVTGKIIRENIMGNKTMTEIAMELNYSVSHIYALKQKIFKEFATIIFEVVVL